jgi:hypothetical protein
LKQSARGRYRLFLGLTLGRCELPWAPLSLLQKHAPRPAGASLDREFAIVEGAVSGISQSVGTNGIATTRSAAGFFVAGKLVGDRRSDAKLPK